MRLPLHVSVYLFDQIQGGAHAVLCAVIRLDPADVRSLIGCVVCGCMSLPSVCMYVLSSCPGEVWSWNPWIPCAPPEDGRIGRPKHVRAISPKCF